MMPLHSLRRNYARSRNGLATYRLLHDGIKLSTEQLAVADKAINGTDNLFITGSAGTGKSFLMQHVIRVLEETYRVAVTASTGMAAAHVGGSTLHSFAGIGCGIKPGGTVQELLATIQKNKRLQSKWNKLDVLFIDEISMVDSDVFSLVDQVGRGLRKRQDRPFGGLRLILSGDFFQLPPVQLGKLSWASAPSEPTKKGFAFECTAWNESNIQVLHLSESHRHHSDPDFASLLEEIRFGRLSKISLDILNKRNVDYTPPPDDKIKPTHIYCRNKDVDMENEERLRELPGREIVFEAVDSWNFAEPSSSSTPFPGKPQSKSYDDLSATVKQKAYKDMSLIAPKAIILKIGAQVMLTKNDHLNGLVNGSRGVVTAFINTLPVVLFDNQTKILVNFSNSDLLLRPEYKISMIRKQLPLKLAWAMTVHRSQGSTISRAEIMVSNAFDYGQVFVALSRVKSLNGLWLRGKPLKASNITAHPIVSQVFGR